MSDADYNPPVVDLDFRRNLWQTCKAGLNDLTLKVGEKEIKVNYFDRTILFNIFRCPKLFWLRSPLFSTRCCF